MTSRARSAPGTPRARRGALARLGGALFWTAEALLAGPVAIGLAAAWLHPRPFWWAQIVAVALPYAAWLLAAWTGVVLLTPRRRVAVAHAALLALVLWRAAPLAPGPADPALLAGDDVLRVVTFNVPQVGPSREVLGDSVVAYVGAARPHVLAYQDAWIFEDEAGRRDERAVQVAAVERDLAYTARLPERLREAPGWRRPGTGVPVLVRGGVQTRRSEAVPLDGLGEVTSLASRTEIEWAGRPLAVYNLHLRSFGEDKPWLDPAVRQGRLRDRLRATVPYLRRYRQVYAERADEVEALAAVVAADSLPALVVGDLNSTADNWSARRLRAAGARRTDAQRARGRGWGRTYHAERPLVRIDVIYADPALEVLGAETTAVTFSDHRPLRAWLRWRDAPAAGAEADPAET